MYLLVYDVKNPQRTKQSSYLLKPLQIVESDFTKFDVIFFNQNINMKTHVLKAISLYFCAK